MSSAPKLLAFVAHPDDESFGCGSLLAQAAARGYDVAVCTATMGELGEPAAGYDLAGRSLAECRWTELLEATALLGARCLPSLGLSDSGWGNELAPGSLCATDVADVAKLVGSTIVAHQPDVVVVIAGDDGHRDHVRLRDIVRDAFPVSAPSGSSLYQWCLPNRLMRRWAREVARLRPDTAHLALAELGTADEMITTVVDTSEQLARRRAAIAAHASQTSPYQGLSEDLEREFLTRDHLIRVYPTPPAGLREDWFCR